MKRVSVRNTPVSIKEKPLQELCSAVSGAKCISRFRISELAGVSLMTVSKFTNALLSSSLMTEKDGKPEEGGRKRGILYWNGAYSVAVFDISSRVYSMTAVSFAMKEKLKVTYYYNDDFTEYENLSIFLGKCHNETKSVKGITAIGVIVPDRARVIAERLFPPPEFSCKEINRIFSDVLNLVPDIIIPFSDSVIGGIKCNIAPSSSELDVGYILAGRTLGCIFSGSDGMRRIATPQDLIYNGKPLSQTMRRLPLDPAPINAVINAMRAMYDTDIILIESDIKDYLFIPEIPASGEIYLDGKLPLYVYGCACRLREISVIRALSHGSDE